MQNETSQIHWWVNDNNKNITTWDILNFHTKIGSNALIKQVDFRDGEGVTFPLFKSKLQKFQPNRENAYCTKEFSNRKV